MYLGQADPAGGDNREDDWSQFGLTRDPKNPNLLQGPPTAIYAYAEYRKGIEGNGQEK